MTRLPSDLLAEITTHLAMDLGPDVPLAAIGPVVERCAEDLHGQTSSGAYPELVARLARERLEAWFRDADLLALGRTSSSTRRVVGSHEPVSRVRRLTQPAGEHEALVDPDPQAVMVGLPADPRSPREARAWVHTVLGRGVPTTMVETAELLVSELVTNALRHAQTEVSVCLRREGRSLRIEVHDGQASTVARTSLSGGLPRQDQLHEHGRGLFLVDALADRWGVTGRAWGKSVWCELSLS